MIEEALRRIEVTKKEKLGYLDLRGLELISIPQEILEVPWIGALSLSNNKISDLTILSQMRQVHKLALTNNCIEDISVLKLMPKLRFIFLGNNLIKDISKISTQERLKKLVLNSNKIEFLPDLSHLSLLAYLDIDDNPLTPPSVEEIKSMLPCIKIYKY